MNNDPNNFASFRVYSNPDGEHYKALLVFNVSAFCFYLIQGVYGCFLLWRILNKDVRSRSLIAATILIIYASLMLAALFGFEKFSIDA